MATKAAYVKAFKAGETALGADRFSDAIPHFKRAVKLAEADGLDTSNKLGFAVLLQMLGACQDKAEDFAGAMQQLERALVIISTLDRREADVASTYATTLSSLALVYGHQGRTTESIKWQEQALAVYEGMGNELGVITTLLNLGGQYCNTGDSRKGLLAMQRCRDLASSTPAKAAMFAVRLASIAANTAGLHLSMGQHAEAMICLKDALARKTTLYGENSVEVAITVASMGAAYLQAYDLDRSVESLRTACASYERLGMRSSTQTASVRVTWGQP